MTLPVANKADAAAACDHITHSDETYPFVGDNVDQLVDVLSSDDSKIKILQIHGGKCVGKRRLAKEAARKYGATVNGQSREQIHLYMVRLENCETYEGFVDEIRYEFKRYEKGQKADSDKLSLKHMLGTSSHSNLFILDSMDAIVEMNSGVELGKILQCITQLMEETDTRFIITSSVRVCFPRSEDIVYEYLCNPMKPVYAGFLLRQVAGDVQGLDDETVGKIVKLSKRIPLAIMLIGQKMKPSKQRVWYSPEELLLLLNRSVSDTLANRYAPLRDQIDKVVKNYFASLNAKERLFLAKNQNNPISPENPLTATKAAKIVQGNEAEVKHDILESLVNKSVLSPMECNDSASSSFLSYDMMDVHFQENFLTYIDQNVNEFLTKLSYLICSFLADQGFCKREIEKTLATQRHIRTPLWDAFFSLIVLEDDASDDERRGLQIQAIDSAVSFFKNGFRYCPLDFVKTALSMMTRLEEERELRITVVAEDAPCVRVGKVVNKGLVGSDKANKKDQMYEEPVAEVSPAQPITKPVEKDPLGQVQQQPIKLVPPSAYELQQKILECSSEEKVSSDHPLDKQPVQESSSEGETSPTRSPTSDTPTSDTPKLMHGQSKKTVRNESTSQDNSLHKWTGSASASVSNTIDTSMRHFSSASTICDNTVMRNHQDVSLPDSAKTVQVPSTTADGEAMRHYSSVSTVFDSTELTNEDEVSLDKNSTQQSPIRERCLGTSDMPGSLKSVEPGVPVHLTNISQEHPGKSYESVFDRNQSGTSSIHSLKSHSPLDDTNSQHKIPPPQSPKHFPLSKNKGTGGQADQILNTTLEDQVQEPEQSHTSHGFQVGNKDHSSNSFGQSTYHGSQSERSTIRANYTLSEELQRHEGLDDCGRNSNGFPPSSGTHPQKHHPRDPDKESAHERSTLPREFEKLSFHQPYGHCVPTSQADHRQDPANSSGIPQTMYGNEYHKESMYQPQYTGNGKMPMVSPTYAQGYHTVPRQQMISPHQDISPHVNASYPEQWRSSGVHPTSPQYTPSQQSTVSQTQEMQHPTNRHHQMGPEIHPPDQERQFLPGVSSNSQQMTHQRYPLTQPQWIPSQGQSSSSQQKRQYQRVDVQERPFQRYTKPHQPEGIPQQNFVIPQQHTSSQEYYATSQQNPSHEYRTSSEQQRSPQQQEYPLSPELSPNGYGAFQYPPHERMSTVRYQQQTSPYRYPQPSVNPQMSPQENQFTSPGQSRNGHATTTTGHPQHPQMFTEGYSQQISPHRYPPSTNLQMATQGYPLSPKQFPDTAIQQSLHHQMSAQRYSQQGIPPQASPTLQMSPRELQTSPRELQMSPGELQMSPRELQMSPQELQMSPRELQTSPRELQMSPQEYQSPNGYRMTQQPWHQQISTEQYSQQQQTTQHMRYPPSAFLQMSPQGYHLRSPDTAMQQEPTNNIHAASFQHRTPHNASSTQERLTPPPPQEHFTFSQQQIPPNTKPSTTTPSPQEQFAFSQRQIPPNATSSQERTTPPPPQDHIAFSQHQRQVQEQMMRMAQQQTSPKEHDGSKQSKPYHR